MKNLTLSCALLCMLLSSCEQQPPVVTTLILIRHAEKDNDGTKDPDLSDDGKSRAADLARVLGSTTIDAIYSTPFKRTEATVSPLAIIKNLEVNHYEAMKGEEMDKILETHKGGTVVISGHSNTTPWIANYFTGMEYADFDDADYDNMMVLSIVEKGNTKVTWLNYGRTTP